VPALRIRPAGSAPTVTDQLSGAVPPLAAAVCEYAMPTVLPGNAFVVIAGAAAIAIDSALETAAPTLSVTRSVKPAVPAVVGVPVIAPVPALRFSPAGSAPTVT